MHGDPLNDAFIGRLRADGLLKIDDRQVWRMRKYLASRLRDLDHDDDAGWVSIRSRYLLESWPKDFFHLSKQIESPIEQQLGGYLLCAIDGYNEIVYDGLLGVSSAPDFGTYFRCQQHMYGCYLDFLFKVNLDGDWKVLNVECDGHNYHDRTKAQAARDKSRDRLLIQKGVQVIRFTGSEIYNRPEECLEEVENILAMIAGDLLAEHGHGPLPRRPIVPAT